MKHLLISAGMMFMLALQPTIAQMADKMDEKVGKKTGNLEEQIITLSDKGRDAALKGDTSFLEQHTTDDYTVITGSGAVVTKSEAIQMRKNGDVKYSAIDVSDKKVRVHGNTAILTATVNMKGTMKNNDISGTYRIAQVWVRQSGKWKVANMQSTKVQGTGS
jgi:hypothetical protein